MLLNTADHQVLGLENWCIKLSESNKTSKPTVTYQKAYKEMKALVTSLVTATRALPAFQLARKQSKETYVVTMRVLTEQPNTNLLGTAPVALKIGKVVIPRGDVVLGVTYRTRSSMFVSPQSSRVLTDGLRADHFDLKSTPSSVIPTSHIEKISSRYKLKARFYTVFSRTSAPIKASTYTAQILHFTGGCWVDVR